MKVAMYDPKFEQAVQKKMEELEFHPGEAVWANIEKAVAGQRRRRGLLFWRFLLPVLFLAAGAGGYYYFEGKTSLATPGKVESMTPGKVELTTPGKNAIPATVKTPVVGANASSATLVTSATVNGGAVGSAGPAATGSAVQNATPAGQTSTPVASIVGAQIRQRSKGGSSVANNGNTYGSWDKTGSRNRAGNGDKAVSGGKGWHGIGRMNAPATEQGSQETADEERASKENGSNGQEAGANGSFSAGKAPAPSQETVITYTDGVSKAHRAWLYMPLLADPRFKPNIGAASLSTKKATASIVLPQKKRPWEAGFVAGGGISRLNRLNAEKANAAVAYTAASFYTINRSASTKGFISDVRPDASFTGGIYLQKPISDRWIFHTGMNLQYYSTRITIGSQLDANVPAAASFIVPNALTVASTTPMYTSGDRQVRTNSYYFLELPVAMQWKLSRSRVLPIFLEGGLSLNRLMSANALFYNAKTGIYSKDPDMVNRTQLNLSSALMIGLPFHSIRIQVGPQIQYGVTPLVNNQSVGDQHFFYTGVRLVVLPGRK